MNRKLQVFVSSTYTDLIEERQAAVEAILDAGHIPAGMELFKAGKSQMTTICKWIDDSDVYMLILGGRYGSIEEESGLSYTELEYRYARSKDMPVVTIILDDSYLFTKAASQGKDAIFEKDNIDKYESFKQFVQTNIVRFAKNIDKIGSIIPSHLSYLLSDTSYHLIGWIRNTQPDEETSSPTKKNFSELINILKKQKFIFPASVLQSSNDFEIDRLSLFVFCYKLYSDHLHFIEPNDNPNAIKNNFLYRDVSTYFQNYNLIKQDRKASCFQLTEYGRDFFIEAEKEESVNCKLIQELNKYYEDIIINGFYACI